MSDVKKPTTTSILRSEQLAIGYCSKKGTHYVAENLNLKLKRGQLVCLLGKNGVGKSTLCEHSPKHNTNWAELFFLKTEISQKLTVGNWHKK